MNQQPPSKRSFATYNRMPLIGKNGKTHPYDRLIINMKNKENNQYRAAFFIVPSYILDIPNITLSYVKVYETIFQFWNHSKPCYLSLEVISERTGVGKSQICEALNFFEGKGELLRRKKGGRRYFIQPERAIPDDCSKNIPESGGADSRVLMIAQKIYQSPAERTAESGGADTNNKKLNKEYNIIPPISPTGEKKGGFGISEMLENNPFNIPEPILADWLKVRKGKRAVMTETAWTDVIKNVHTISAQGIEPLEIFKIAVRRSWAGIEVSFYKDYLPEDPKQLKYVPKEDRAAKYEKIAARERAAEQRKKEEIKAAKEFNKIKQHVNLLALKKHQTEEMKKLGLNTIQYHEYITKKKSFHNNALKAENNFIETRSQ
jgi:hypothetical protein